VATTGATGSTGFQIDEDLWFGTTDDEAAEHAAANSMAAMVGRLLGAKPFPEAARKLADLARDENFKIDDVVQVLERDPALSARLLRLVNSASFGLHQRCTSVRHAATLVGATRLQQVATTAAVMELFDSGSALAARILDHSSVVGGFSRYLAVHLSLPSDDLFTAGFLHDIGKLMLLESEGESYEQLLAAAAGSADKLHVAERATLGFDHGVLAAHVMKAWNIPDPIPKVVAWHHESAKALSFSTHIAAMVETVRLADALTYAVENGVTHEGLGDIARHQSATYLDISEAQLAAMWDELNDLYARTLDKDGGAAAAPRSVAKARPAKPAAEVRETPKQFPCVDCGAPSFGDTCSACGGHTCPEHRVGREEWCTLCARDYVQLNEQLRCPPQAKLALGALIVGILLTLVITLIHLGTDYLAQALLPPLLNVAFAVVVLTLGRKWVARRRFAATRPDRSSWPEPSKETGETVIEPSLRP